jgi:type IV pilus assembly protein PilC
MARKKKNNASQEKPAAAPRREERRDEGKPSPARSSEKAPAPADDDDDDSLGPPPAKRRDESVRQMLDPKEDATHAADDSDLSDEEVNEEVYDDEEEDDSDAEEYGDEEEYEDEGEEEEDEAPPAKSSAAPSAESRRTLPPRANVSRSLHAAPLQPRGAAERRPVRGGGASGTSLRPQGARGRIVIEEPAEAKGRSTFSDKLDALLHFNVLGPRRPSLASLAHFTRKLSALISAGIPLVRSLKLLAERTVSRDLKAATTAVARDVESGATFSESMSRHPVIFDQIIVSVVQIGEVGGILEESLRRLSEILDRKSRVRKQVAAAAMYPVVLSVLSIATVVVIMMTIVPQFVETFEYIDVELPGPTLFVIAVSDHLMSYWILDLVIAVVGVWLIRNWVSNTTSGRRQWERIMLRAPMVGSIVQLLNSARFCRTLGGLLSAGIPLWESLGVAGQTSESVLVGERVNRVRDAVEKGQKLEPTLRESKVFTEEMLDIVGIGEEAGMLDRMLLSLATDYEDEIQARLTTLIELLKPILLIVVGGCIVLILIAVYLPYFSIVKGIGNE